MVNTTYTVLTFWLIVKEFNMNIESIKKTFETFKDELPWDLSYNHISNKKFELLTTDKKLIFSKGMVVKRYGDEFENEFIIKVSDVSEQTFT